MKHSCLYSSCAHSQGSRSPGSKTAGGDTVAWVGFEILRRSCGLGISARRAEWFVRWTREMASRPVVNMDNFEEGLGRLMYAAGALEYERPCLVPLYKFLNVHPRGSTRKLPSFVAFILRHLSNQVERERHLSCATRMLPTDTSPRVDTRVRETRTGNRRVATSSSHARSSRSLALTLVQCGDHTRSLALGVREGMQTLSDHLDREKH